MALSQAKRRKKVITYDPQKEKIINMLSSILDDAGFHVRREKLKQGYGWKVLSGSCCLERQDLIFVDRRLPQDEQLSFIVSKIIALKIDIKPESLLGLPEKLVNQLKSQVKNDSEEADMLLDAVGNA